MPNLRKSDILIREEVINLPIIPVILKRVDVFSPQHRQKESRERESYSLNSMNRR